MINSGRAAAVMTVVLLLAAAFQAYAVWRLDVEGESSAWSIVVGVGLVVLVIPLILWVIVLKAWRVTARLLRPELQIARWQISPDTWEAFRAYEERHRKAEGSLPNFLKAGRKPLRKPMEVIAARGGMLIGGRLFSVEPRGMQALRQVRWHKGPPECLELVMLETTMFNTGSALRTQTRWVAVRLPVEPAQREAAVATYHFYTAFEKAGEISNPRPARIAFKVALVLAAVGLPLGAVGFWMNDQGIMANSLVPPLLALLGTLGGGGALVFAGVVWLVMLRKR